MDGFINVLADACPRPCLLERLAASQLGPGGVTLLTDKACAHADAHGDSCRIWSNFLVLKHENGQFGGASGFYAPPASNHGKTLRLIANKAEGL